MKAPIDVTLTGPDRPVEGMARLICYPGYDNVYEFKSADEKLKLVIGHDTSGNWQRIAGTDPYFSAWVDELAGQVSDKKA